MTTVQLTSPKTIGTLAAACLAASVCGVSAQPGVRPGGAAGRATVTATAETFGMSSQGRPLRVEIRGLAGATRNVLVIGCIHGNECAGMPILNALPREPPAGVRFWIVGSLNPDGRAARTRQNARGVDLNRNFAYRWQAAGRRGDTYYPGPRAASEPETRAMQRLIRRARPDVTIWYHQHLRMVEPGGRRPGLARRYARLVNLPVRMLPAYHGTATGWQNHSFANSTAFVVELPAGALGARQARRHARAVLAIAQRA